MKSFRLRLALLVGVVTALLLVAIGVYAWRLSLRFNLDRLDRELRNLGAANLERVVGDDHWRRFESALGFVSGADRPPRYAIWVENYGRETYRSPHWPHEIRPESLVRPATYEGGISFDRPPRPPRTGEPLSPENPPLPRLEPYFLDGTSAGHAWRLAVMGTPYTALVLAANLDDFHAELRGLRQAFFGALVVALLAVSGGAWFFAARALRPVTALTRAAENITTRGLDQRIAAPAHDREFQRLITVFNAMMDRLENGFLQARRFSADTSHELKTPLARLQIELEQALESAPTGSPQQAVYSSLLEEIHRLKAIVQKLLLLSLADSGRLNLERTPVDLSAIISNVLEDCIALAPKLQVEQNIPPGIIVSADSVLLEEAVQNIANNTVKHNRDGGLVRITLEIKPAFGIITVGNTGPGIPLQDQPRMFERFYRGDPARDRDRCSGVGLGLSLAREILRAHGGDLVLGRTDNDWTEFVVTIPVLGRM